MTTLRHVLYLTNVISTNKEYFIAPITIVAFNLGCTNKQKDALTVYIGDCFGNKITGIHTEIKIESSMDDNKSGPSGDFKSKDGKSFTFDFCGAVQKSDTKYGIFASQVTIKNGDSINEQLKVQTKKKQFIFFSFYFVQLHTNLKKKGQTNVQTNKK